MEMKDLEKELEKSVGEIIIDLQRKIRELEEENKKLRELLNKNENVILNIRDMLYDNEGGEYTYERDIIRAKLDREYNYINGDDIVDFYQRKKD